MNSLYDFFTKVEHSRWSGEVQVMASEGKATVIIQEGQFLYAYRPFDRALERLQKWEDFNTPPEEVLESCRSWEDFVKAINLANSKNLDTLVKHLKTERLELFFRIFFWSNIELLPNSADIKLENSPELSFYTPKRLSNLLQEAQTREEEWPRIQERIKSSKRVFMSTIPLSETSETGSSRDPIDEALAGAELEDPPNYSLEEMEIIRLCNGRNRIQDIVHQSIDGEFLVLRRIIDLWDRGVILPKDEEASVKHTTDQRPALSRHDFKVAFLSLLFLGAIYAFYATQSPPTPTQQAGIYELNEALEVYWAENARYPATLGELESLGTLSSFELIETRYRYSLINNRRYRLSPVDTTPQP